jgi:release factor glutamine methyltransferase
MSGTDEFALRRAALTARLQLLPDKPEETVDATLCTLWQLAAGRPMSVETAADLSVPPLDEEGLRRLDALIEQRLIGVPLAHLSGRQQFMGLEMLAGKDALIPRRETELLGRAALDVLRKVAASRESVRVVDVCTGSGNLALSFAHYEPKAQVFASDLSPEAVALAARNAEHLGLASRVEWRCGDLLDPFDTPDFHGQVDLLCCNPPYISSGKVDTMASEIAGFEPRLAFDGGPLGVKILQKLIREAPKFVAPGGWLAFEVGLGQGPAVLKRMQSGGAFSAFETVSDEAGEIRSILARR